MDSFASGFGEKTSSSFAFARMNRGSRPRGTNGYFSFSWVYELYQNAVEQLNLGFIKTLHGNHQ